MAELLGFCRQLKWGKPTKSAKGDAFVSPLSDKIYAYTYIYELPECQLFLSIG